MRYLKLYENWQQLTTSDQMFYKQLIQTNYNRITELIKYFIKNCKKMKYYNGWKLEINHDIMKLYEHEFVWTKGDLMLRDRFSNEVEKFYLNSILYCGDHLSNKWSKRIEVPENIEEQKKFFDEYFKSKPNILYCAENTNKATDFIKFLIETIGTKINIRSSMVGLQKVPGLKIDDIIEGDFILQIVKNNDAFTPYEIYFKRKHCSLTEYPIEKLIKLYEYLAKKYPKLSVGKEWGFFDLKDG